MSIEAKGVVSRRSLLTAGALGAATLVSGDARHLIGLIAPEKSKRPERQLYNPHIVRFAEENPEGRSFVLPKSAFRGSTYDTGSMHDRLVPFPSDIVRNLEPVLHLVNGVLTPQNQVHGLSLGQIEVNTSSGDIQYLQSYSNLGRPNINVIMHPGIPYSYEDMNRVIFHESMHRLNNQGKNATANAPQSYTFWEKINNTHGKHEKSSSYELAKYDSHIDLAQTGLFPLFDESSYIIHSLPSMGRQGRDQGEPYTGPDELLASTLNVLRHFPRGFMASVDTLPPEWGELVKEFTRFALTQSQRAASNSENFARLFSPQLISFLRK